jgi:hypothetical protein
MSRPSAEKRSKERARQQKQKDKAADREARKRDKGARVVGAEGEDPDLIGIVAGPQPIVED